MCMRPIFLTSIVVLLTGTACDRRAAPKRAAAPLGSAQSATLALEQLDGRKPLPLLPMMANHQKQNMREHLVHVQQLVRGLANDDFAAVEEAARGLGSSEQMGKTCTHMGAAAPEFTQQALAFHQIADGIAVAAGTRDAIGVLSALDATLRACTACHASWQQRVVDEAAWREVAATHVP
jgi:hypothetical protein